MKMLRERLTRRVCFALLALTLGAVGVSYFVWSTFIRKREEVFVHIKLERPRYLVPPSFPDHFDLDEFVGLQRQLVASPLVVVRALRSSQLPLPARLKELANPVDYLVERIETSMVSPAVMEVRLAGDDLTAQERVALLDALINAYVEEQRSYEKRPELIERLKAQENILDEKMRRLLDEQVKTEGEKSIEWAVRKPEFEVTADIYRKVVTRILELEINRNVQCVTLLENAMIRTK